LTESQNDARGGGLLTFSPHADFETFLESTMLTLVAMMLVDRAVAATATRVSQVATHGPLKETLASLARQHAVVFTGTFVAADDALGVELQPVGGRAGDLVAVTRRVRHRRDVRVLLLLLSVRLMMTRLM